jgi:hypothetical protein
VAKVAQHFSGAEQNALQVGGLFYNNYPGGSGLTSGAVFGRIAGRSVALNARVGSAEK